MHLRLSLFFVLVCLQVQAQQTFVPDDNFEQGLIDLGLDTAPLDDFVDTAMISSRTSLFLENKSIVDMTGIEDFESLTLIDLSGNLIEELDLSQNTNLQRIDVYDNNLSSLNIKHGNLYNMLSFNAQLNPNLFCIDVDDVAYATSNLIFIDSQSQFGDNCESLSTTSVLAPSVVVYPNPVQDELHIKLPNVSTYKIEIFNMSGQLLSQLESHKSEFTLDTSNLKPGIYFVKINHSVKKIIKH